MPLSYFLVLVACPFFQNICYKLLSQPLTLDLGDWNCHSAESSYTTNTIGCRLRHINLRCPLNPFLLPTEWIDERASCI